MTRLEESCIDGALFWLHDAAATLTGEERRRLGEKPSSGGLACAILIKTSRTSFSFLLT